MEMVASAPPSWGRFHCLRNHTGGGASRRHLCDTPARFRPAPRGISTTRCLVASGLIQEQELRALFRSKKWLGARGLKTSATAADRREFIRAISFAYTSQPKIEAEP